MSVTTSPVPPLPAWCNEDGYRRWLRGPEGERARKRHERDLLIQEYLGYEETRHRLNAWFKLVPAQSPLEPEKRQKWGRRIAAAVAVWYSTLDDFGAPVGQHYRRVFDWTEMHRLPAWVGAEPVGEPSMVELQHFMMGLEKMAADGSLYRGPTAPVGKETGS